MKPLYAILIDGAYLRQKLYERAGHKQDPSADDVVAECDRLQKLAPVAGYELLRIYYYDALPPTGKVKYPVSGAPFDLADNERFQSAKRLVDQLTVKPHFAMRLGQVTVSPNTWKMKANKPKKLIQDRRPLEDDDFVLDATQKGVDMRIGMDIARLALRQMVRAVIVVTGDSDFVPAFKLARQEGLKVILDPMTKRAANELRQHADVVI